MSTRLDQWRNAIELACLTEDRSDAEQRSLIAFAVHVDKTANQLIVTNQREGPAWRLHRLVEGTRVVHDKQRNLVVDDVTRLRLDRQADLWNQARAPEPQGSNP